MSIWPLYKIFLLRYTMKKVSFNNQVAILDTWSSFEYDRCQIESILYKKSYNRINDSEWVNLYKRLYKFKINEMSVYIDNQLSV
jgi:hypothetical protein